jgi:hypothetical protein
MWWRLSAWTNFRAPELRPAVGVEHTAGHIASLLDGVVQGSDREPGLHP